MILMRQPQFQIKQRNPPFVVFHKSKGNLHLKGSSLELKRTHPTDHRHKTCQPQPFVTPPSKAHLIAANGEKTEHPGEDKADKENRQCRYQGPGLVGDQQALCKVGVLQTFSVVAADLALTPPKTKPNEEGTLVRNQIQTKK